jgi:hypothetical protein
MIYLFKCIFGIPALILLGFIVIAVGVRYTGPVIRRAFRAWREHWEARAGAHLIDMIRKGKGGI